MTPEERRRQRISARFWRHVDTSGTCWRWTGRMSGNGYGEIMIDRERFLAHRLAWEVVHGPIPPGLSVLHTCDCPPCVNPAHLWLGSQADNVADMIRKRRGGGGERYRSHPRPDQLARGERHGNARLTDAQVGAIRAEYAAGGVTKTALAGRYGVARTLVGMIVRRQIWRHLP